MSDITVVKWDISAKRMQLTGGRNVEHMNVAAVHESNVPEVAQVSMVNTVKLVRLGY